jgi:hypothetical protein
MDKERVGRCDGALEPATDGATEGTVDNCCVECVTVRCLCTGFWRELVVWSSGACWSLSSQVFLKLMMHSISSPAKTLLSFHCTYARTFVRVAMPHAADLFNSRAMSWCLCLILVHHDMLIVSPHCPS